MGQWFNAPGNNLATVARETGYPVVEVPGWTHRGQGPLGGHVGVIVCHHTAGPDPQQTASNYPSLNVVTYGRPGLRGLLSQYGIGYDGTIYVMGAGLAWHAGRGGWRGRSGNSASIGIEAEDAGDGDWTRAQLDVYPRLCAALARWLGIDAGWVCAHREWTSRKIDPAGIDMGAFRQQVAEYLAYPHRIHRAGGGSTPEPGGIDSMALDTRWQDSYGNTQTVQGWMAETQRDLNEVKAALLQVAQSRIPGDKNVTNMYNLAFDAGSWTNQILGHVVALRGMVAGLDGADPQDVADALRPALVDLVGPVVQAAVHDALGADNSKQAAAIVDAIANRLAGQGGEQ